MSNNRKFNRTAQAPMQTILVGGGDQSLATGALVNGSNAVGIADKQLGVLSTDTTGVALANNFITAGHNTQQVKSVKVLRGTPSSTSLNTISPFRLGHQAYLASNDIFPEDIVEVATTLPEVGKLHMDYLSGFSVPSVGLDYDLTITLQSVENDTDYANQRRNTNLFSVTASNPAPTSPTDEVLQNLALLANRQSILKNPTGKSFVVLGIQTSPATVTAGSFVVGQTYTIATVGTTNYTLIGASANTVGVTFTATGVGAGTGTAVYGTLMSTINAGKVIPVFKLGGIQTNYTATTEFVAALQEALASSAFASTISIVNLGALTPGSAATVNALLVVGLKDSTAVVLDEETRKNVKIVAGSTLNSTRTIACEGKDWVNTGKQWFIQAKKFAKQSFAYFDNWYGSDVSGSIATSPSYVANDDTVFYTSTNITYNTVESHERSLEQRTPHVLTILLPATITNPTATATGTYAFATSDTTTVAALNASLGAWLQDAYNKWTNHKYEFAATAAAPFV